MDIVTRYSLLVIDPNTDERFRIHDQVSLTTVVESARVFSKKGFAVSISEHIRKFEISEEVIFSTLNCEDNPLIRDTKLKELEKF